MVGEGNYFKQLKSMKNVYLYGKCKQVTALDLNSLAVIWVSYLKALFHKDCYQCQLPWQQFVHTQSTPRNCTQVDMDGKFYEMGTRLSLLGFVVQVIVD